MRKSTKDRQRNNRRIAPSLADGAAAEVVYGLGEVGFHVAAGLLDGVLSSGAKAVSAASELASSSFSTGGELASSAFTTGGEILDGSLSLAGSCADLAGGCVDAAGDILGEIIGGL